MAYNPVVENPQALALTAGLNRPQPTGDKYATGPQLLPQVRSQSVGINAGAPLAAHQNALNKLKQEATAQGNKMLLEAEGNRNALARQKLAYDNTLKANEAHRLGLRDQQVDTERRAKLELDAQAVAHHDTRVEAGKHIAAHRDWVDGGQKRFEDAVRDRHILEAVQTDPLLAKRLANTKAKPGTPAYLTEATKIAQEHELLKGERSQAIAAEVRAKGQEVGRRADWGLAMTQKTGHPLIMPGAATGAGTPVSGSTGIPLPSGPLTVDQWITSGSPNQKAGDLAVNLDERIGQTDHGEAALDGALAIPRALNALNSFVRNPDDAYLVQKYDLDKNGRIEGDEEINAVIAGGDGDKHIDTGTVVTAATVGGVIDIGQATVRHVGVKKEFTKLLGEIPETGDFEKLAKDAQEKFVEKHKVGKWEDFESLDDKARAKKILDDRKIQIEEDYKNKRWYKKLIANKGKELLKNKGIKFTQRGLIAGGFLSAAGAIWGLGESFFNADEWNELAETRDKLLLEQKEIDSVYRTTFTIPHLEKELAKINARLAIDPTDANALENKRKIEQAFSTWSAAAATTTP